MTRITAYCNQKGGVGKTTTAFHHAREAARRGLRTLLVDLDPQGNLTRVATSEPVGADQAGMAEVLSARDDATMRDIIVPGVWGGVDVAPTPDYDILAGVQQELILSGAGREQRLREALHQVAGDYDLIIIDCTPSLDLLTINALVAANGVIVVTEAGLFAADGLAKILHTIGSVQAYYNSGLQISGILVNRYDAASPEEVTWAREIRQTAERNGLSMLVTMPKRVAVRKAAEAGVGVDEYGGRSVDEIMSIYKNHMDAVLTEGAQS